MGKKWKEVEGEVRRLELDRILRNRRLWGPEFEGEE